MTGTSSAGAPQPNRWSSDVAQQVTKRRSRVLLLLDAAERAGVAPLATERLHTFAYLANALSPILDIRPFYGVVVKDIGGPFYPELQREADHLVVAGLLEVSDLRYDDRPHEGARIHALYGLRFASDHLEGLLAALGARAPEKALDPRDVQIHRFLVELAGALARLPDDEVAGAGAADMAYADRSIHENNLVYLERKAAGRTNLSVTTAERFGEFFPKGSHLSAGEKLYLYAKYLGRRVHVS